MKTRTIAFLSAVLAFSAVAFAANAETASTTPAAKGYCPSFGESSVTVTLQPFPEKIAAGAFLPVTARITNLKSYPLSGGVLLVRLLAAKPADSDLAGLSGAVLARSVALKDLFIGAKESKAFQFIFSLPTTLPKGSYTLEAVYSLSDSIPDGIDDAPGRGKPNSGSVDLAVEGGAPGEFAYVDAKSATVSEGDDGKVSVSVDVVNTGKTDASVPLLWKAYYGNAAGESSALAGWVSTVKVPASGKAKASYELSDSNYSSYSILAAAAFGGVSSYAAVKAEDVRGGALVKLLGIAPSASGWSAFGCVQNVFTDDPTERLIAMNVTDASGKALATKEFVVAPGKSDMEFSVPFAIGGTGDVVVAADVSSGSGAKMRYEKVFDCKDLGTCVEAVATVVNDKDALLFAGTLLIAGIGGILAVLLRPKREKKPKIFMP